MSKTILSLRVAVIGAAAGACAVAFAGPAAAHVTTTPGQIDRAEYNQIGFRVPNESPTASTIKVEVQLPKDTPITSVRTLPMTGWKATVNKGKLTPPVTVGGAQITESISSVVWTADSGTGIAPGQFGLFEILTGNLPTSTDTLIMPAIETYSDGKVVHWDQPPSETEEPEYPAVTLKLTGSAAEGHGAAEGSSEGDGHQEAAGATDGTARWLGGAGLALGALGVGFGAGAILRSRRRTTSS